MHACTKGLVCFAHFFFFMFCTSQAMHGLKKQKRAPCWSILFFCLWLSRASIYSHVQSTHSLSALFTTTLALHTEWRHCYRSSSQSRPPPHIRSSLFFYSLQKVDVYITSSSSTAQWLFETAMVEVQRRSEGMWESVFKSQERWLRRQRDFFLSTLASTIWASHALREIKKSANGMDRTFESLHFWKFDVPMRIRVERGRERSRHCQHAWQEVWRVLLDWRTCT